METINTKQGKEKKTLLFITENDVYFIDKEKDRSFDILNPCFLLSNQDSRFYFVT